MKMRAIVALPVPDDGCTIKNVYKITAIRLARLVVDSGGSHRSGLIY
jgi:hypothetical protein